MDRTEDLQRLVTLYAPASNDQQVPSSSSSHSHNSNRYVTIARRVVTNIDGNESLVRRMEKLSTRKEFSNDPTQEMTEISDLFHMKVALIQTDFQLLKQMTEVKVQAAASEGQHQMQHYKLMMQTLNKRHLAHVEAFKAALKVHSENLKQRQKRVGKYGQGQDQVRASLVGTGTSSSSSSSTGSSHAPNLEQNSGNTSKHTSTASSNVVSAAISAPSYAMFANQSQTRVEVQIPQELRRRGNVPSHSTAGTPSADVQIQNQLNGDGVSNSSSHSGSGSSMSSSASGLMNAFTAGPPKSTFINGKPSQYQQQYHHGRQQGTAYAGNQYNYNNTYSSSSSGNEYGSNGTGGGGGGGYMQMQLQQQAPSMIQQTRLKSAEQVERSIAQMGQLFSQMATLVMDQSETISRIEDDVEIGLEDTKDAHRSMEEFHAISKGNRGLIIKVFLLLVFFIFLFLVWT